MSEDATLPSGGRATFGRLKRAPSTASPNAPLSNVAPAPQPHAAVEQAGTAGAASQPSQVAPAPSAQPAPAQGAREHRRSPRRRVLKEGKVIFGKAQSVMDVTIDNMSEGGAHIRMLSSHGLPQDFYLCEAARGVIHRAEVAWRTATGMGLRLLGPLEDVAAREAFLRKFRRN